MPQLLPQPNATAGGNATAAAADGGAVFFGTNSTVRAFWGGFLPLGGSPLAYYSARVCRDALAGAGCLTGYTALPGGANASSLEWAHLALDAGITYRVWVRAFDAAGNFVEVASPGQVADFTPPTPPSPPRLVSPVVSSWDAVVLAFDDWEDAESGIEEYTMGIAPLPAAPVVP